MRGVALRARAATKHLPRPLSANHIMSRWKQPPVVAVVKPLFAHKPPWNSGTEAMAI